MTIAERRANPLAEANIPARGGLLRFSEPLTAVAVDRALPALARSRLHRQAAEQLGVEKAVWESVGSPARL
jgi:hypothetical protein